MMNHLFFKFETLNLGRSWLPVVCHLPLSMMALIMGGHIRVGMEDNIYYSRGVLAKTNGQLVERIVRIAGEYGREVATSDEARGILKLPWCCKS